METGLGFGAASSVVETARASTVRSPRCGGNPEPPLAEPGRADHDVSLMPIQVTHIVSPEASYDSARWLSQVLVRLPTSAVRARLVVLGPNPPGLSIPSGVRVRRIGPRVGGVFTATWDLQRLLEREYPDVVHAWGAQAGHLATQAWYGRTPLATSLGDPVEAYETLHWWRSGGSGEGRVDLVCASTAVQRYLTTAGVPEAVTWVVPPGLNDEPITAEQADPLREALGIIGHHPVLMTMTPPSRAGGHFHAVWTVAILRQIWPEVHLLIPGVSREHRRLARLVERIYCPEAFTLCEDRYRPEELLAVSDGLLCFANENVANDQIGLAMIRGVCVIGTGVDSVTELVEDGVTGFVCCSNRPHSLAMRVREVFADDARRRRCCDAAQQRARGHFDRDRAIQSYLTLLTGRGRPVRSAVP